MEYDIIYIEIYNKFEKKHKLQIKLINKLPNINLNNTNEDFINIIKEYEDYLGPERVLAMCNLLEERLDYVRELYTNLSLDYKPQHENILYWIEDRVIPPNRDGIDYILDKMGLNFYDAWAICKANKGMSLEDYWWLNSGEDEYEKCHIRYLIESGKQTYFGRPV